MRNKHLLTFLIIISIARLQTFAQVPIFKSFDIRSENIRPRILKLLRDHNGSIWAGTDNGLFLFDGINFTKIPNSDTIAAINNSFTYRVEPLKVISFFETENTRLQWVRPFKVLGNCLVDSDGENDRPRTVRLLSMCLSQCPATGHLTHVRHGRCDRTHRECGRLARLVRSSQIYYRFGGTQPRSHQY